MTKFFTKETDTPNSLAKTGLIMGIISVFLSWTGLPLIGLVFSIFAAKRGGPKWMVWIGLILNIVYSIDVLVAIIRGFATL